MHCYFMCSIRNSEVLSVGGASFPMKLLDSRNEIEDSCADLEISSAKRETKHHEGLFINQPTHTSRFKSNAKHSQALTMQRAAETARVRAQKPMAHCWRFHLQLARCLERADRIDRFFSMHRMASPRNAFGISRHSKNPVEGFCEYSIGEN